MILFISFHFLTNGLLLKNNLPQLIKFQADLRISLSAISRKGYKISYLMFIFWRVLCYVVISDVHINNIIMMCSLLQIQHFSSSSNLVIINRTNGKTRYQRHIVIYQRSSAEQNWKINQHFINFLCASHLIWMLLQAIAYWLLKTGKHFKTISGYKS